MKEIWFQYLLNNKNFWCVGFTKKRLEKVKEHVFSDKFIISDLLERHNGGNLTPNEMKSHDIKLFDHCISNFTCQISAKMRDLKIVKIKK